MRISVARMAILVGVLLCPFGMLRAGTVHGMVKNGTTGKPAAGVQVILIQLQGGMQPVSSSKSDAQGRFSFDNPGLGTQPMLIRAVYNGINFHQPVPPGTNEVSVEIFEPTKDPKAITVASRIVFFQPNNGTLTVGEEYTIQNSTQPAQAFYRTDGDFDFGVPDGATLQQVAAAGPAGMPVVQAQIEKGKNRFSIAYAFRPGQSTVRYSYEMPYPGNATTLKLPTVYATARLLVVAPPTMQIAGDGLQAGGQEQGMSIYGRENVAAGTLVSVTVSGTAPPADQNNADAGQAQNREARQGTPGGGAIQQVPGRLDGLKWYVVAGFVGLFALGAIFLAQKKVVAIKVPVEVGDEEDGEFSKPNKSKAATNSLAATVSSNARAKTNGASLAEMDAAVGTSLDSLKERLFRLELRRQAGTISEEEYAQERAKAEKVLRDLVRG